MHVQLSKYLLRKTCALTMGMERMLLKPQIIVSEKFFSARNQSQDQRHAKQAFYYVLNPHTTQDAF